ncbi:hypothetical protein, conserved [Plasmodium vivax]|uniref:Uncharacterized protein n=1 Tax=Plasmodium vivax (strain Salvador I) TaxID=126793 RepID=A5KAX2_PLAVS|nr:hypothetical protein, conserved [Plasmodium vivax]EDL43489.1 hypothetical protein, conserved [Plasmodium vivax]|eukprot:XP_001613216.1 hypothetical protein [Plasmodium vivax Sal-1]
MDENKKVFYSYVDNMHRKNEEIHKIMEMKEKIKKEEQKKIEESQRIIKNNQVSIDTVDDAHKAKELTCVNLKKEISIQKRKLQNLNTLLGELPDVIQGEEEKYSEFKKNSRKEIGELMKTLESPLYTGSADDVWDKIKECQSNADQLNSAIYEAHGELAQLNMQYNSSKEKFRDLVEVERNKNKKLKKISATLQFIQNLKKGTNGKANDEGDLKKKLEEINDLYR